MEAQHGGTQEGGFRLWTTPRTVHLESDRAGYVRGTVLTFNRTARLTGRRAEFRVELAPRESWALCVDITPVVDGKRHPPLLRCGSFHRHAAKMPVSLDTWLEEAPDLETEDWALGRIYRQSLLDLAALRIRPDGATVKSAMPGGGVPWYMAMFGRDAIIASYQALPFRADLARATLEALADKQATTWDNDRDAEPGKIMHELRRGTLAALGRTAHSPYYGTHDATLLWLILLEEYWRWSGDRAFLRRMERHARAAVGWMDGPADLDGDGYLEYAKRSRLQGALDNHCWKDSAGSILFADGRRAEGPIATCEIQGYAYDARLRSAALLREVWNDHEEATRLEEDAAKLRDRFNRDFYIPSRGHYALALDGSKEPVDSMTSNVGHLLWSGIVDEDRAAAVVRRLLRDDMFSGWGIRSMSSADAGYQPLDYHVGSVWPHDTAIVAEGMRRYGFRDEAARLSKALLDAAEAFSHQLPEVFAGFPRDDTGMPVEYPGALKPQAWAAGAPLLAMRTLLGLDVDGGRVRSDPHLAEGQDPIRLRGISFRGTRVDL